MTTLRPNRRVEPQIREISALGRAQVGIFAHFAQKQAQIAAQIERNAVESLEIAVQTHEKLAKSVYSRRNEWRFLDILWGALSLVHQLYYSPGFQLPLKGCNLDVRPRDFLQKSVMEAYVRLRLVRTSHGCELATEIPPPRPTIRAEQLVALDRALQDNHGEHYWETSGYLREQEVDAALGTVLTQSE